MSETTVTREEVLRSMPERQRMWCLSDELVYGQFYAEQTDDGWRRLDPVEQIEQTTERERKRPTHGNQAGPCAICGDVAYPKYGEFLCPTHATLTHARSVKENPILEAER